MDKPEILSFPNRYTIFTQKKHSNMKHSDPMGAIYLRHLQDKLAELDQEREIILIAIEGVETANRSIAESIAWAKRRGDVP